MKKSISMKDIAKELNVSIVTVSKALGDKEGVSEEMRNKVTKLANEMGYRCNTLARSMKEGRSYNIGVIVAEKFIGDNNQSFYLNFYRHISGILEKYGYYGILQELSTEDEENRVLPRLYNENRVDGLIMLGQVSTGYIEVLQQIEIPVVFLDFYDEHANFDSVITDNFYGAYEITNYLLKSGHKDVAFVGNIFATSSIQDRFLGFYKSLLEHRIKLEESHIICDRAESGRYIDLKLPDKIPTAFVCNCDAIARNLIGRLGELGLKVPEDVSVVGFDNDIYATISAPYITTVEVDIEAMAKTAIKFVIEKIRKENKKYGRVSIKGRIVYRDSVKVLGL